MCSTLNVFDGEECYLYGVNGLALDDKHKVDRYLKISFSRFLMVKKPSVLVQKINKKIIIFRK